MAKITDKSYLVTLNYVIIYLAQSGYTRILVNCSFNDVEAIIFKLHVKFNSSVG